MVKMPTSHTSVFVDKKVPLEMARPRYHILVKLPHPTRVWSPFKSWWGRNQINNMLQKQLLAINFIIFQNIGRNMSMDEGQRFAVFK